MLIALEGLDASGKNSQAHLLCDRFIQNGLSSVVFSFPRYGKTLFSQVVVAYLNGEYGDVYSVSPYLSALLFAGDRFESRNQLIDASKHNQVVILDRYVASNLAYQAAKLPIDKRLDFINWLSEVEFNIYQLPQPSLSIYLDVPVVTTKKLTHQRRKKDYSIELMDIHERDDEYLLSCAEAYNLLMQLNIGGAWQKVGCMDINGRLLSLNEISEAIWRTILSLDLLDSKC